MLDFLDSVPLSAIFIGFLVPLYPISKFLLMNVQSKKFQIAFHIIYGLIVQFCLFREQTFIVILVIIIEYIIMYLPTTLANILTCLVALSCNLYSFMNSKEYTFDFTCTTLVAFQKCFSLRFNLADGSKIKKGIEIKRERWRAVAISDVPPFADFFAYIITPFGAFSNPFIEYKSFDYLLNAYTRKNEIKSDEKKKAFFKFICGIIYSIISKLAMDNLNFSFYHSDFYLKQIIPVRMLMVIGTTVALSHRYYPAWSFIEAGLFELGLLTNGFVDGDDVQNNSYIYCLLSTSYVEWMRRWNHTTHLFFKNYVFTRLLNIGVSSFVSGIIVNFSSSIWHGFHPMLFLMLPENILNEQADTLWHKLYPITDNTSTLVIWLHRFFVWLSVFYGASTWYFPSMECFFYLRKTVYFFSPVTSLLLITYLKTHTKKLSSKEKQA